MSFEAHPMDPQSVFPTPIPSRIAGRLSRDLAALVAGNALDEQLLAITVQLRNPMPCSDLLMLARLSVAVHDCTPATDEHVLRQRAVVYARDNLFK